MVRRIVFSCLGLLAACATQPATSPRPTVFFEEWSARLSDKALAVIASAAKQSVADPAAQFQVIGYADPTGSAQANVYMSETRMQVVADALVGDGVAPGRISHASRGATAFTGDSQESRRVEIVVTP